MLKSGTGTGTVIGGGCACGATCSATLDAGTPVTLTATPDAGSTFAGWTGCDTVSGATCSVTMNAARSVTASFGLVQHALTVLKSGTGSGTVAGAGGAISCGATCSATLDAGTLVTLTATPDAGSTFAGWTGCDTVSGATCSVTMNAARSVTASFGLVQHALTVLKSGTGSGTVAGAGGAIACGATCSATLDAGTLVTLTATPDAGSTFAGWTGCDTVSGATCSVTMNAARSVTASFGLSPGSLHVVNGTSYTIAELHVSPAGAGTWGPNQLVSPIAPAGTFTLVDIPVGTYDFRAVASDGVTFWQTNSVAVTAGGQATWTLQPPGPTVGSLSVANGTSYTIAELYVSPAGAGTWGPNQLVSAIAPAGTFTLTDISAGTYDFLAVASDGISHWRTSSVSIPPGGLVAWSLLTPDLGSLTVVNHHCVTLTELRLKPSSSPSWTPNQLALPVDPAGGTFTLTGIPVGAYDVSAVAIDGVSWLNNGVAVLAGEITTSPLYMPANTGCLTVVNNTPDTIDFFYAPLSPAGCSADNWGNEHLLGQSILPQTSWTLSNVAPGAHDLRAIGVTPQADPVNRQLCGMGIPRGGTFFWYFLPP